VGVSQDRAMYSLGTALSVPQDRSKIDGGSVSQDTDMGDTEWSSDLSRGLRRQQLMKWSAKSFRGFINGNGQCCH